MPKLDPFDPSIPQLEQTMILRYRYQDLHTRKPSATGPLILYDDAIKAVLEFLQAKGHDLCHTNRQKLAEAFGLADQVPPLPATRQEMLEQCKVYVDSLPWPGDSEKPCTIPFPSQPEDKMGQCPFPAIANQATLQPTCTAQDRWCDKPHAERERLQQALLTVQAKNDLTKSAIEKSRPANLSPEKPPAPTPQPIPKPAGSEPAQPLKQDTGHRSQRFDPFAIEQQLNKEEAATKSKPGKKSDKKTAVKQDAPIDVEQLIKDAADNPPEA